MMDVVGIGSALFDILMTADEFPKEDTKIQGKQTKTQGGGPCAVALVAMSKLGVSSRKQLIEIYSHLPLEKA